MAAAASSCIRSAGIQNPINVRAGANDADIRMKPTVAALLYRKQAQTICGSHVAGNEHVLRALGQQAVQSRHMGRYALQGDFWLDDQVWMPPVGWPD